ncbi:MAG: hypothetical protein C3F07_00635 [Anaerolineales bacterium]|nr:MAG: hypothetical protein C3F07_00635 [Anaerolineales bacterium]
MNITRQALIVLLLGGILMSSCGGQNAEAPTQDLNEVLTAAVGTVVESVMQTQTALAPVATPTPLDSPTPPPTNSPIALPTGTNQPTATAIYFNVATWTPSITPTGTIYTPTTNPSTLANGCNNLLLLRDETIPAGTEMKPGEKFTKTWKVANNGTCDWLLQYRIVFVGGEAMGGEDPGGRLGKVIEPGKWTQISIVLTAPSKGGSYTGYWRLATGSGDAFGSTLGTSIVVKEPPSYP